MTDHLTTQVTVEDLLAGASVRHELEIPNHILQPWKGAASDGSDRPMTFQVKPLTIGEFQLILRAAKTDEAMIPLLMVKEAVVEPILRLDQIQKMHIGLITYLVDTIRTLSGMTEKKKD